MEFYAVKMQVALSDKPQVKQKQRALCDTSPLFIHL